MPGRSSQFVVLTRAFFARFFDTEITGGAADLRLSLFWLMAFLAVPGIWLPAMQSIAYNVIAIVDGPEVLRIVSRGNKTFYLALTMVASGGVCAFVWNSLLLDRRDSLVLGTLPVRGPTIVRAKIAALGVYIVMIAIAMHTAASFSYGICLGARSSFAFNLLGIIAHFVASTGASAFVFLAIASIQGLLLAMLGPRRFDVVSPILQVLVVAGCVVGLATLHVFDFTGAEPAPWLKWTPPIWFLGLYERVLITDDPMLIEFSRTAVAAMAILAVVALVSCSLAYRRLASAVAEGGDTRKQTRTSRRIASWLVSGLSAASVTRASVQFFLAAIARSSRHRFVAVGALGLPIAIAGPVLMRALPEANAAASLPSVALLAMPIQAMVFLLVGLRIAASLPTDVRAGWAVQAIGPPTRPLRAGAWRTMFVLGAVPVTLLTMPIYWRVWGADVAVAHALVCLTLGATLTEALLWGSDELPCSRPWRPEHANLRTRWPAYLLALFVITVIIPAIERQIFGSLTAELVFVGTFAALGVILRFTHRRRRLLPDEDPDEPDAVQLLNLN